MDEAQKVRIIKRAGCATLPHDEARTLWLAVLHGLTIIQIALRKYLRVEGCDTCGK